MLAEKKVEQTIHELEKINSKIEPKHLEMIVEALEQGEATTMQLRKRLGFKLSTSKISGICRSENVPIIEKTGSITIRYNDDERAIWALKEVVEQCQKN